MPSTERGLCAYPPCALLPSHEVACPTGFAKYDQFGGVYLGVHPQSLHTPSQAPPELVPFFGFVIGVKLEALHGSHVV